MGRLRPCRARDHVRHGRRCGVHLRRRSIRQGHLGRKSSHGRLGLVVPRRLHRNVRTWKHRDGDGRHRKPVRSSVGRPHHRSGRVHRHRHVLFGDHLPRGLCVDRQRRHGPTMGCSHSPSQPIRSPPFAPPPAPWTPPPQASRAYAWVFQVEGVKPPVQRGQPVQRRWRSEAAEAAAAAAVADAVVADDQSAERPSVTKPFQRRMYAMKTGLRSAAASASGENGGRAGT